MVKPCRVKIEAERSMYIGCFAGVQSGAKRVGGGTEGVWQRYVFADGKQGC